MGFILIEKYPNHIVRTEVDSWVRCAHEVLKFSVLSAGQMSLMLTDSCST